MGVRTFGDQVPWKSWVGNRATCVLMRLMVGQNLSDTQTGCAAYLTRSYRTCYE